MYICIHIYTHIYTYIIHLYAKTHFTHMYIRYWKYHINATLNIIISLGCFCAWKIVKILGSSVLGTKKSKRVANVDRSQPVVTPVFVVSHYLVTTRYIYDYIISEVRYIFHVTSASCNLRMISPLSKHSERVLHTLYLT